MCYVMQDSSPIMDVLAFIGCLFFAAFLFGALGGFDDKQPNEKQPTTARAEAKE